MYRIVNYFGFCICMNLNDLEYSLNHLDLTGLCSRILGNVLDSTQLFPLLMVVVVKVSSVMVNFKMGVYIRASNKKECVGEK